MTTKEKETVKILVRLGDSARLAVKTVIADRQIEEMKSSQLNDFFKTNN
jgi:hypothetical protein